MHPPNHERWLILVFTCCLDPEASGYSSNVCYGFVMELATEQMEVRGAITPKLP